jgi:hypothetical protein
MYNDPVITALPLNGNVPPVVEFSAYDAVVANEELMVFDAQLAVPTNVPVNDPENDPVLI